MRKNPVFVAAIIAPVLALFPACKPRRSAPNSALLDTAPSEDSYFSYMNPERLKTLLADEFRRIPVQGGTNVVSFNFADMAGVNTGFNGSVKSLDQNEFLRSDSWRLSTDILPGTLIEDAAGNSLPISVQIRAGREITYMRVFGDKTKALTAFPKLPTDLPLTSAKAAAMAVGDFVSLPVFMGVTLGVMRGAEIPSVAMQASAGLVWQGEFRLNVVRLENNFVRVKVAPKDSKGFTLGADAGIQLNFFGYGPFGLIDLDRQAERLAGLDIFRLAKNRVHQGEAMVIDYVLNLNDSYGRMAYDLMLKDTLTFRSPDLIRQAMGDVGNITFADVTLAETLHSLDVALPPEQKRAARVFRGSRFYTEDTSSGRFGTRLLRLSNSKTLSFNWLQTTNERDEGARYFYHLFSENRKQSSWISDWRRNYSNGAVAFFSLVNDQEAFHDIVFTWEGSESKARPEEVAGFAWNLYASLGNYYHQMRFSEGFQKATTDKFSAKVTVVIHQELFAAMYDLAVANPQLFEKQLWTAIWMLTPRFQGRLGPRTPAPAASLLGQARNLMTNSLLAIQQTVRNVLNTQWEGVYGTTASRLVGETAQLRTISPRAYFQSVLKLLHADESAREIVPAFYLALCELYQKEPYITVQMANRDLPLLDQTLGANPREDLQTMTAGIFQRINHMGYER